MNTLSNRHLVDILLKGYWEIGGAVKEDAFIIGTKDRSLDLLTSIVQKMHTRYLNPS